MGMISSGATYLIFTQASVKGSKNADLLSLVVWVVSVRILIEVVLHRVILAA